MAIRAAAPAKKGWELITRQVVTPGAATVDFNGYFSSKYKNYKLKITGLYGSVATTWGLRLSSDNGATYLNTLYAYAGNYINETPSNNAFGASSTTQILLANTTTNNAATGAFNGIIFIPDPLNAAPLRNLFWEGAFYSGSSVVQTSGAGKHNTAAAHQAFRIFPVTGGNIQGGIFSLYGLKET